MTDTITIDDHQVPFEAGQTIMEAARAAGLYIEHLCYNPAYQPHGSCKLCSVKVDGVIQTACTMPAIAGQKVESDSPEMKSRRKTLVEMIFAEGNHYCAFCIKSGSCDLQALAYHLDMHENSFNHRYPVRVIDASHPDLILDHDRCIFCGLCIRASRDQDHKNVFTMAGRGKATRLAVNSETGKLGDSTIAADDAAAHVCPVGAIMPRRGAYSTPIGERYFDARGIDEIDNASGKL
ncbi:2Fe-2S iron-sulfur cluster binding domain-containing protein [Pseudohalioglobus sediminis]|uniref:2Fe-2S iron-sulfur cluster binding domain-containing protein n=1 Tax=Pseudohalioglobus sediminis TaxID=2606449 RepID=A0A5B0WPL5_9GAMM|nr:2Fe-2S iron-sulfur cluster-binding protein [Pseudohalioglobus sediminis]KAA1187939.1 2Fe-2S iron-sulfur cluster binding domain-containing protein [Pseudohalioglobus sediminis]